MRDVGYRIRELRIQKGWTQEQVAEKLGVALRNYQEMERGRQNLTLRTLTRMAHVLEREVSEFFEEPSSREVLVGRPPKLR